MRWTVRRLDVRCGAAAGCTVLAGDPVAEYCGGRLLRCASHAAIAHGDEVDWTEVELERYRIEADLAAAAQTQLDRTPRPPARYRRPRPLVSAAAAEAVVRQAGLFDHRAAQLGRDTAEE